jgi:hemerythrin-like metal-binding protein
LKQAKQTMGSQYLELGVEIALTHHEWYDGRGYPQLEEHKIIHRAFVRWVTELREEYVTYGKRPLGESVLLYLRDWLSHHILGEDQRYRPYIEAID